MALRVDKTPGILFHLRLSLSPLPAPQSWSLWPGTCVVCAQAQAYDIL